MTCDPDRLSMPFAVPFTDMNDMMESGLTAGAVALVSWRRLSDRDEAPSFDEETALEEPDPAAIPDPVFLKT